MTDRERVLGAMRSGEWLRSQWVARVAFDLGTARWLPEHAARFNAAVAPLREEGLVERRVVQAGRSGEINGHAVAFSIPRYEWRLIDVEADA